MSRADKMALISFLILITGVAIEAYAVWTLVMLFGGEHWPHGILGVLALAYLCIGMFVLLYDLLVLYAFPDYDKMGEEVLLVKDWLSVLFTVQFVMLNILGLPSYWYRQSKGIA